MSRNELDIAAERTRVQDQVLGARIFVGQAIKCLERAVKIVEDLDVEDDYILRVISSIRIDLGPKIGRLETIHEQIPHLIRKDK